MQRSYIWTTMFYANDYCVRVTDVDPSTIHDGANQMIGPMPYQYQPNLPKANTRLNIASYSYSQAGPLWGNTLSTWRQVTINLGQEYIVDWVDWWPNQTETCRIPYSWQMEVSLDGETFIPAFRVNQFKHFLGTAFKINALYAGQFTQVTSLVPLKTHFVRFQFHNAIRENNLDEWAVELRLTPSSPAENRETLPVQGFICA